MNASPVSVLVIGESLIDVISSAESTVEHPGGSPMNVAVGLAKLQRATELLTEIGDDERGRRIVDSLQAAEVSLTPGSISSTPTSTSTASLSSDGSASYTFAIEWSLSSVSTLPLAPIVHTGSIAAFLQPGAARISALLAAVPERTIVSFDPNIRPTIIGSRDESAQIVASLAAHCTIVKLSDEDALWLYGTTDANDTVDVLLGLGATLAIVTLGGDGALLATAGNRVSVPGESVDLVDTIGAGDSFMSGILHGIAGLLESGTDAAQIIDGAALTVPVLEQLGGFAAHCAAITVSRAGANPPTLSEAS